MSSISEMVQVREMQARLDRLAAAVVEQAEQIVGLRAALTEFEVRLDDIKAAIGVLKTMPQQQHGAVNNRR